METKAKVYDITTPPVDMTSQYWLMAIVAIVALAVATIFFIWEHKSPYDYLERPWRGAIGLVALLVAVFGTLAWGPSIDGSMKNTVDYNIGSETAKVANLDRITPIMGYRFEGGFVGIDGNGDTIIGHVTPYDEKNHYKVTIDYYK